MSPSRLGHAMPLRWRALLCVLALVGLGVGGAVGGPFGPGSASAATPAATPVAGGVLVQVTAVEPQVLQPTQDLVVTATIRNDTAAVLENPRATLRISRFRLASTTQLETWAGSAVAADAGKAVGSVDIPGPLAPGMSVQATLTVPASAFALLNTPDAWGPRGLAVELTDAGRRLGLDRTFLLWLPDETAPTASPVSVLVPVVGPASAPAATTTPSPAPTPASTPSPAATASVGSSAAALALDALTSASGRLRAVIDATGHHTEVSWAVDPSLVEAAAAGGSSSTSWLADLTQRSARRDVLALPWGDPDLAAIAHADRPDLLTLARDASASSAATVFGGSPQTQLMWAADDIPDATTASLAVRSGARALVVGPQALAPTDGATPTRSGTVAVQTDAGSLTALVPDAALTAALTDAKAVDPGATAATAAQRILAETAVAAHEKASAGQHLLAALPRDWVPDVPIVQAQLDALATAPWVDLTSVTGLIGRARDSSARTPLPTSTRSAQELSPAHVGALGDARAAVAAFATVVAVPDALLAGLDREILSPLSVAWRDAPSKRSALVNTVLTDANARRTGLSVLVSPKFNVIASATQIRLTVHNALPQAATVRVDLRPRKACLTVPDGPTPATVAAESDATVTVDVQANANCDVAVDVYLLASDGTIVASPAQFSARLAPTIENVGTLAVGALLALGLVVGIVRTVRRGQTANRGARVPASAATAPAEEDIP
ncbi:MAG TPA: DUF6049 family protein [Cellulomonas sp.]|uniref:DUF6049 family protein n=1 Tax=Cellulomonas sp. TaxID=40001 RepID=UPI002E34B0DC|nr:DUF6049 family protein [Cellulomonas sp.]HEX5331536.1 DUF6049 family protein [Cellulomonas sp.]